MKKLIFTFFFLYFALFSLIADESSFLSLSIDQGLKSNTINCIYKDSWNFVWLGTANGLNRFDGSDVLSFSEFDGKSIISILDADSTSLYVLSEKELSKYNRKSRTNLTFSFPEIENISLKAFALDRNGGLYIVGNNRLFYLPEDKQTISEWSESIPENKMLANIYIDENNICWLLSSDGLIKYDLSSGKFSNYDYPSDNNFLFSSTDGNNLFITTQNNNVLSFNVKEEKFEFITTLQTTYIQAISYYDNKLYVGTNGNGLKIINLKNKSVSSINRNSSEFRGLNSNAIYSVLVDDNSFFIGTFSGGLNYIPSNKAIFNAFDSQSLFNTANQNVRSFHIIDNTGHGMFGTRNGLVYNRNGEHLWYTTDDTPELKSNIILYIHPYGNDFLIGTYGGGLSLFETKTRSLKNFIDDPFFTRNSFYSIIEDRNGNIWFGSLSGLIKYEPDNKNYTVFNTSNSGLVSDDIYSILQDSLGRIWIATRGGICYYENGLIQQPASIDLTSIGIVRYLYEDSSHNIWLGCENQGIVKIKHDLSSFEHYTAQDFLPDNYVSSIIEGKPGELWIATHKGIVLYNDNTAEYSIFSMYDGIQNYSFNNGAVQKTDNNIIWWGNEKGLVNLDFLTVKKTVVNPVYITKIVIDGFPEEEVIKKLQFAPEYLDIIELPSSQANFIFRFSDLEYDYPSSIIYEYRLEGLQDTWQKTLAGEDIIISDIPSGSYMLKIRKAGDNDSVKTVKINKRKSYTLYWSVLIVIVLITVMVFMYRWFVQKLKNYTRFLKSDKEQVKAKYQSQKIEKEELENIKLQLIKYMEEEKPYLDPNLKLEDIAKAINRPKAKISQVLSQYLDTNFSNFVSKYRIEMFKEKATDGLIRQYTLTALAKECGFNSRSSFFNTMKKLTGQTPSEFLKDAGINIDNS